MTSIVNAILGAKTMDDKIIALDLLNGSKSSILALAGALTQSATPQVRLVIKKQLDDAVAAHDRIYEYVSSQGWYNPYNIDDQILADIQESETALKTVQ